MKPNQRRNLAPLLAAALLALAASAIAADKGSWSYSGATGPTKWGKMDKEFALCGNGQLQAPIDIPDSKARKGDIPPVLFNYKPSAYTIVDDGHTIVVKFPAGTGSKMTLEGEPYELTAIEFHKPAEMKVDGKVHDMSAHLMHKARDGKLLIVAVSLDQGNENALIKSFWTHMPNTKGKEVEIAEKVNPTALLPSSKGYYAFGGSLTTPPCTESVSWVVMQKPVQISADQVRQFAKVYPNNARPTQPVNDRDIQGSL